MKYEFSYLDPSIVVERPWLNAHDINILIYFFGVIIHIMANASRFSRSSPRRRDDTDANGQQRSSSNRSAKFLSLTSAEKEDGLVLLLAWLARNGITIPWLSISVPFVHHLYPISLVFFSSIKLASACLHEPEYQQDNAGRSDPQTFTQQAADVCKEAFIKGTIMDAPYITACLYQLFRSLSGWGVLDLEAVQSSFPCIRHWRLDIVLCIVLLDQIPYWRARFGFPAKACASENDPKGSKSDEQDTQGKTSDKPVTQSKKLEHKDADYMEYKGRYFYKRILDAAKLPQSSTTGSTGSVAPILYTASIEYLKQQRDATVTFESTFGRFKSRIYSFMHDITVYSGLGGLIVLGRAAWNRDQIAFPKLQKENNELRIELTEMKDHFDWYADHTEELMLALRTKSHERWMELERQRDSTRRRLSADEITKFQMKGLRRENQALENCKKNSLSVIECLKDDNTTLRRENDDLKAENDKRKTEDDDHSKLKQQHEALRAQHTKLQQDTKKLVDWADQGYANGLRLQEQLKSYQQDANKQTLPVQTSTAQCDSLQKLLATTKRELEQTKKTALDLSKRNGEMIRSLFERGIELENTQKKLRSTESSLETRKMALSRVAKHAEETGDRLTALKTETDTVRAECKKHTEDYTVHMDDLAATLRYRDRTIKTLTATVSERDNTLKTAEETHRKAVDRLIQDNRKAADEYIKHHHTTIQDFVAKIASDNDLRERLRNVSSLEDLRQRLLYVFDDVNIALFELEEKIVDYAKVNQLFREKLRKTKSLLRKSDGELGMVMKVCRNSIEQGRTLREEKGMLEERLDRAVRNGEEAVEIEKEDGEGDEMEVEVEDEDEEEEDLVIRTVKEETRTTGPKDEGKVPEQVDVEKNLGGEAEGLESGEWTEVDEFADDEVNDLGGEEWNKQL